MNNYCAIRTLKDMRKGYPPHEALVDDAGKPIIELSFASHTIIGLEHPARFVVCRHCATLFLEEMEVVFEQADVLIGNGGSPETFVPLGSPKTVMCPSCIGRGVTSNGIIGDDVLCGQCGGRGSVPA